MDLDQSRRALVEKMSQHACPEFKEGFVRFIGEADVIGSGMAFVEHAPTCTRCGTAVQAMHEIDLKLMENP
jgi:hypothetical protein